MNLEDALGGWPSGGDNNPPTNPTWPGQPAANPTWPGAPAAGGGAWPGGPAAGGGAWPAGPAAGGGAWPAGPAGGGGAWPGGPAAGGGAWPAGPAGGGSAQPSQPGWPSPSPGPGPGPGPMVGPGPGPGPGYAPQQNLAVPYKLDLPSGVHDKMLITINGIIKPRADKITIDFHASNDLAFHFNPRFNEDGRKVIVRNSCIGKQWGKEEREHQTFPFQLGQPFEMKIMCTNKEFKVAVNHSHLLSFHHRVNNLRSINRINIYNDLSLTNVKVESM
ncbi:galectin-3b isoform X2 [Eleginops maclovinus]|uniref:galectin-3b isoform X2 n=1 Tax=Eleginops maclovinus TaxID=56733 RepID=UPI003080A7D7